jgi:hypothetical protein
MLVATAALVGKDFEPVSKDLKPVSGKYLERPRGRQRPRTYSTISHLSSRHFLLKVLEPGTNS